MERGSPNSESSAPGLVQAVSRALSLLTCFWGDEVYVPLHVLARRSGMPKPTTLRLARTLAASRFLVQREDGAWRLGPAAALIGSRYQAQFDAHAVIEPVLQELATASGESASFFIYEEDIRSCLMRCEGPQGLRRHVRLGELLPLDKGSAGKVILAALGRPGATYESIRERGFCVTRGERSPDAASVSAAVMGATMGANIAPQGTVLGSVSISGPALRLTAAKLQKLAPHVLRAAAKLSYSLSGMPAASIRSTWYPA
ncbi:IclR family transcriptional regulator [Cupriavidus plantarum]|uniref:IclR family transcriptional regulator n=2 Tax=Cupriavidus plantarum TaxID=942865 RepID=A0A316FC35_9BURK|nr:IclR family transcriptional regulator [Cupriavidus plantarum]PWK34990.1 IclR family transcriptional regulator [Cupriavidus plantarum]RLK38863.1 IclR family transcriptional regulator [Cupriavidus plantarum]